MAPRCSRARALLGVEEAGGGGGGGGGEGGPEGGRAPERPRPPTPPAEQPRATATSCPTVRVSGGSGGGSPRREAPFAMPRTLAEAALGLRRLSRSRGERASGTSSRRSRTGRVHR